MLKFTYQTWIKKPANSSFLKKNIKEFIITLIISYDQYSKKKLNFIENLSIIDLLFNQKNPENLFNF